MSTNRSYRYQLSERELKEMRLTALRASIRDSVSVWQSLAKRSSELGIESAVTSNQAWDELDRAISGSVRQAERESNEALLMEIRDRVENSVIAANRIVDEAYGRELERQRKEAELRRALSALESLRTAVGALRANEVVQRWEPDEMAAISDETQSLDGLLKDRYIEIPMRCQALSDRIAKARRDAERREQVYNEVTLVKVKLEKVLTKLGFFFDSEEKREGRDFKGYVISAQNYANRSLHVVVGADGKVRDAFGQYSGRDCFVDADAYGRFLKEDHGVTMLDIHEDPPRDTPRDRYTTEMNLPDDQESERSGGSL